MCSAFVLGDSLSSCLVLQEGMEGRRGRVAKSSGMGDFLWIQVEKLPQG